MACQSAVGHYRQKNIQRIRSKPINTNLLASNQQNSLRARFQTLKTGELGDNSPKTAAKALFTPTADERSADFQKRIGVIGDGASSPGSPPGLDNSEGSTPSSPDLEHLSDIGEAWSWDFLPTKATPDLSLTQSPDGCQNQSSKKVNDRPKVNLPKQYAYSYSQNSASDRNFRSAVAAQSQSVPNFHLFDDGDTRPKVKLAGIGKATYMRVLKLRVPQPCTKEVQGPAILDPKPVNLREESEFFRQCHHELLLQASESLWKTPAGLLQMPVESILEPLLRTLLKDYKNRPIGVDPELGNKDYYGNKHPMIDIRFLYACTALYNIGLRILYEQNVIAMDISPLAEQRGRYAEWPKGFGLDIARQYVDKLVLRCFWRSNWVDSIRVLRTFCVGTGPNGTNRALKSLCFDMRDGSWFQSMQDVYENDQEDYKDGRAMPYGINNHPDGDWQPERKSRNRRNLRGQNFESRYTFIEQAAPEQIPILLKRVGIDVLVPVKGKGLVPGPITIAHVRTDDVLGEDGLVARMLFPDLKEACQKLGYRVGDGEESYYDGGWSSWNKAAQGEWSWD